MFHIWSINTKKYYTKDSCNPLSYANNLRNGKLDRSIGLPDSSQIDYFFADVNNDKQLDGLITFNPICCACTDTNIIMTQSHILVISDKNNYVVNDTFFRHIISDTLPVDYAFEIDSMSSNRFFGALMISNKQNGCSSKKLISIIYDKMELQFEQTKYDGKSVMFNEKYPVEAESPPRDSAEKTSESFSKQKRL